jgi:outer membrane immunogenic protein
MTRYQLIAAAAISLLVAGNEANAQTNRQMFTGSYIGSQGGYGSATTKTSVTGPGGFPLKDEDDGAFIGGGFVGYGSTNGGHLYGGLEAEGLISSIKESGTDAGVTLTVKQTYNFGISGRIGYVVTDNVLAYGRVGWVWTKFEPTATNGLDRLNDNDWFNGPRVGGGVEIAMGSGLFGRIEYSHTWYQNNKYRIGGETLKLGRNENVFMVGLGYRF